MDELGKEFLIALYGVELGERQKEFFEDYVEYEMKIKKSTNIVAMSLDYTTALMRTKECEEVDELKMEWNSYFLARDLKNIKSKYLNSKLHYQDRLFNTRRLVEVIEKFFKGRDIFEMKVMYGREADIICIKYDEEYFVGSGDYISNEYKIESNGVWFVEEEINDEGEFYLTGNKWFVEWDEEHKAVHESRFGNKTYYDTILDFEYLFESVEEEADFCEI